MKLLLTNDDGIKAKGLFMLAKELEKEHELIIAAPSEQRSACSHSITLTKPLFVKEELINGLKSKAYSIDGTPADCVKIALEKILDDKVDMVISGINNGLNLGTDVLYSGTVSAAIEAAINKVPSIAISMETKENIEEYDNAVECVNKILKCVQIESMKNDIVLNVNVPLVSKNDIKGIKVCRLGNRLYNNVYIKINSSKKETEYKVHGEIIDMDKENKESDINYHKEGYITVTPLHFDLTNYRIVKDIEELLDNDSIQ